MMTDTKHSKPSGSSKDWSVDSLLQAVSDSLSKLKAYTSKHEQETYIINQSVKLELAYDALKASHKGRTKSAYVDELEALDTLRDDAYKTILLMTQAQLRVPQEPIRKAAAKVLEELRAYKGVANNSLAEESAQLHQILLLLKSESLAEEVRLLNLTSYITTLKNAQANFDAVYQKRLDEKLKTEVGKTRHLKNKLAEEYNLTLSLVANLAKVTETNAGMTRLAKDLVAIKKLYKSSKRVPKKEQAEETVTHTDQPGTE